MLLSIIAVIVVLSPIVIIHEFGHFIACRLTGIGVKEFSFGFGKILWHKKSAKGTDFQIRAIPFGGFVEPEGQMFLEDDNKELPKPNEFAAKKWYAKFFMVVNGALFNYVLAAVIFAGLIYWRGMPETDPAKLPAQVGSVVENYPAGKIGLQPEDLITSLNGTPVENWLELTRALQERKGDLADYVISGFSKEDRETVEEAILRAADAAVCIVEKGIEAAMGEYNSKAKTVKKAEEEKR